MHAHQEEGRLASCRARRRKIIYQACPRLENICANMMERLACIDN